MSTLADAISIAIGAAARAVGQSGLPGSTSPDQSKSGALIYGGTVWTMALRNFRPQASARLAAGNGLFPPDADANFINDNVLYHEGD